MRRLLHGHDLHGVDKSTSFALSQALLSSGLSLSIPAFYLVLTDEGNTALNTYARLAGHILYGVVCLFLLLSLFLRYRWPAKSPHLAWHWLDWCLMIGTAASVFPSALPWGWFEWLLRLTLCGAIFFRLSTLIASHIGPRRLPQTVIFALMVLATSGAGFLWLEPKIHTYADGVWLAFTTGATVGYGDLVPSTPSSRIFAAFIVLLGYALFSVVTANIAALLVGEDEKRLRQEMHADMRLLRNEIAALRKEIKLMRPTPLTVAPVGDQNAHGSVRDSVPDSVQQETLPDAGEHNEN